MGIVEKIEKNLFLTFIHIFIIFFSKELRSKEDELKQKQLQQRQREENLQKRAQELDAREIELLGRELNIMITQNTPTPNKRRGRFSKTRLKVSNE